MTRINSNLDPKKLTDQHLMAEYRELPMVVSSLRRSLRTQSVKAVLKKIPKRFTLNTGHVLFFVDKLIFLKKRYESLILELIDRGYEIDLERTLKLDDIPIEFFNDWSNDESSLSILYERLILRINAKLEWYRYYGKRIDNNFLLNYQ
jgi:deoxyribonuclease (pyrimidine dimer)